MVFQRSKKRVGKRVCTKMYLRCHHRQRNTGKNNTDLKTTHKLHSNKNCDCPAQITLTVLAPHKRHQGYLIEVKLHHTHNHSINVADALRFRPISEETKSKYYDLFKQGHSPSSAHLEYETNLMYTYNPQLLADRNINPKISDVYNIFNKWRQDHLGMRTGKELFIELEKRVNIYNEKNKDIDGKASIQRFCKSEGKCDDQPLILAICTPLMSRVHQHIQQSKELVFIDSSSSFDDYNNPMFVISTSSAAGGLPLGVVVTSGESSSIINSAMTHLKCLFPKHSFYGKGSPDNIITDDSQAERDGLRRTWPNSSMYLCVFHFLQSMWRWQLNSKNKINIQHRQYLMQLMRNIVYAKTEENLDHKYELLKQDPTAKLYINFIKHVAMYWERRQEWAICYRDSTSTRGINTNNYAEAGIRILKDIVFQRIRAYNLVQIFEFIAVTFEMYYERRLLAVAYNRMDRYIAIRYKGLGASKINDDDIIKADKTDFLYFVRSKHSDQDYVIDTNKWTCSCSVGITGLPSGEPCKHQHAVANKYKLSSPNLIPFFNGRGRYLHAVIALGENRAGTETFYVNLHDKDIAAYMPVNSTESSELITPTSSDSDDSATDNLEYLTNLLSERDDLAQDVSQLCYSFVEDVSKRTKQMDTQYLLGLKKFFSTYLETVSGSEPELSATPKLSSLLHTYFRKYDKTAPIAGSRRISVQPTAISRRREGAPRGTKLASSGRPVKRPHAEPDCAVQNKRGRKDHTKRKQHLKQNETKNRANCFKHGRGH